MNRGDQPGGPAVTDRIDWKGAMVEYQAADGVWQVKAAVWHLTPSDVRWQQCDSGGIWQTLACHIE